MQELVAIGNDIAAAETAAQATGGVLYVARDGAARGNTAPDGASKPLPFRTLVRAATDSIATLLPAAQLGLYVVFSRTIRTRPVAVQPGEVSPGVTAVFALVHHPELTHTQADTHWRETHAPLALKHHPGMWDYTQLSVVSPVLGWADAQAPVGEHYDGFALVSFASESDLRTRFFGDENDVKTIAADVSKFADVERSPRRVVATEQIFGQRPPMAEASWPHD